MPDKSTWADLLDDRRPALCRVCGSVALPTRTWICVPPTRGMIMQKTWLCNCGLRYQDLTMVKTKESFDDEQ